MPGWSASANRRGWRRGPPGSGRCGSRSVTSRSKRRKTSGCQSQALPVGRVMPARLGAQILSQANRQAARSALGLVLAGIAVRASSPFSSASRVAGRGARNSALSSCSTYRDQRRECRRRSARSAGQAVPDFTALAKSRTVRGSRNIPLLGHIRHQQ